MNYAGESAVDPAAELLRQAGATVTERMASYGAPELNHGAIAEAWTTYLRRRGLLSGDARLDARDHDLMMILVKVLRDAHVRKPDNVLDVAGYAACAARVGTGS